LPAARQLLSANCVCLLVLPHAEESSSPCHDLLR
jgi:hypothetical protein